MPKQELVQHSKVNYKLYEYAASNSFGANTFSRPAAAHAGHLEPLQPGQGPQRSDAAEGPEDLDGTVAGHAQELKQQVRQRGLQHFVLTSIVSKSQGFLYVCNLTLFLCLSLTLSLSLCLSLSLSLQIQLEPLLC